MNPYFLNHIINALTNHSFLILTKFYHRITNPQDVSFVFMGFFIALMTSCGALK